MKDKLPEKTSRMHFGVEGDSISVVFNGEGWENRVNCGTEKQLVELLSGVEECDSVYCSSSIDFPEEQTSEKWILDFCEQLRS